MSIVGGLDVHRQQITFDYLDTETGEVSVGQIPAADRRALAAWLARRFADRPDHGEIEFSVEGCTGWRYVAEELAAAGMRARLAEPADTAAARGRKKRARPTGPMPVTSETCCCRVGCRPAGSRRRRCSRRERCWAATRTCAGITRRGCSGSTQCCSTRELRFHQGASVCTDLSTPSGRQTLANVAAEQLSPAGRTQVAAAVLMVEATEAQMEVVYRQLVWTARHMRGPRVLVQRLYGVGPITALALTCWLGGAGRFSSARKAVRFAGLDITVYSSAGKRSPGRLCRQGPAVLRWCLYEAGKTHARPAAPDYPYYAGAKKRLDSKRAALSEARKLVRKAVHILTELGDDAFAYV